MPVLRLPARSTLLSNFRLHTHSRHNHPRPQTALLHTAPPKSAQTANDASKKSNLLDKDAINTSSNEYSKSGGGDAEIAHSDAAFDPGETGPEETKRGVQVCCSILFFSEFPFILGFSVHSSLALFVQS